MDELIQATRLGKATVYHLYPGKDDLVAAYLARLAGTILGDIDAEITGHDGDPAAALLAILDASEADLRRPGLRGCAFNNASIGIGWQGLGRMAGQWVRPRCSPSPPRRSTTADG
jgi:AcrR family transcriptional regulator